MDFHYNKGDTSMMMKKDRLLSILGFEIHQDDGIMCSSSSSSLEFLNTLLSFHDNGSD